MAGEGAGDGAPGDVVRPRFRPGGQTDLAPAGQGERARANLAALQALRVLEREQRPATEEEQTVLARWSGWGALPVIFNPRRGRDAFDTDDAYERAAARWDAVSDLREQIRALLTQDEWDAARRNTLNAHYTDAALVRSIWGTVRTLGFTGGRVLEPGSGSGNFIGLAPILVRDTIRMTGVEVEPTTAAIARHLYPDAEIITSGLEQIELADGAFDAVVGNVPYGRYKRFDKVHNKDLTLSIHDHFVLKSLYATRPGGIVALITSRYTLDAEKTEARERMYELGDLVGAVRLPAGAHGAAAGTDVVTDVLFLRRRMEGEEPGDKTWLTATKRALPGHERELAVNHFFDAHPEYVLGELRAGSREWGPEVTVVGRSDQTPAEALAAAAAAIAVDAQAAGLLAAEDQRAEPVAAIVPGGTEDALGLDAEGNPTIVENGRPVPLDVHPVQREQLVKLIRLKHLTLALYEAEGDTLEPGETPQLARLRAELRVGWRDYRKSHPPLTKPRLHYKFTPPEAKARAAEEGLKEVPEAWKARTAFAYIDDDPDAALLFGLEEWDDRTRKGIEQKVLHARVLEPRTLPVRAATAEDAIALAMEYDGGRLEMTRVASLLGSDVETVAAQVADASLAYRDPEQGGAEGEVWEPAHRYLSGNVRTKLAAARAAAETDPTLLGNVAALERIQPTDLTPAEIKAKIGAPWVPVDVYDAFLAHLGFENASVVHAGGTVWEVRGAHHGDLARKEWGTSSRSTQDLFTALLRQTDSTIQVTHTNAEGKTWVDRDATDEAQEKAKLIAEAFDDWVWSDKPRAERLAGIYNQVFNNLVMPEYSGSALVLPGLIADWEMRDHQNAAIRRIVNEPTALLAHVVGAGKTATMAAGAMELRRTGLAKKPALVVPNHMLKQWTREFRQLYPNAKILAIAASDLSVKRRAKFMARMAGGEWDAVIFTHDAFNRVPLRPDTTMRDYLDQEMRSLRDQLDVAAEAGMGRNTVKQIEESIANAEAKLQKQIESLGDDNGVFLEDTGVDYLFLDEAHEYKNLRTVSAIPGAAIQGSAKATKLHMVLSWLRETNESDRVATLATGTPIANSVTEAYVLKRYLAPTLLAEMGLDAFDNWAATFGEVVSNLEPDPKGDGYKYKARFARFFNVPELMAGYRTFADVQMAEDLNLPTPPVRENEDGQRGESILIPPTPAQREFIKQLPHKPWVRKPGGVLKALGEGLRASVDLDLVDATDALRALGINPNRIMSTDPDTGEQVIDYTKVAELADLAATDMRSVGGTKDMGSKVPYAAEKIMEIWHETKDIVYPVSDKDPTPQDLPGGLQLVFLDEGTPGSKAKHGTNLYADLREELVARGMPREAIRFIHEAGTDLKKEKLFADCRAGRVRVLIGSTQKMGTGTNIQDRAVALHHLSYPWRPADMAQRDGRIERRGNLNAPWIDNTPDDVRVLYYITERTFDEFRLTTLARKARFIGQIQRREFNLREIEDIGADALNLGMLAALSSGDPAILQLAEATAERSRLQGLARSWDRTQDNRAQDLKDIDSYVARAEHALTRMREAAPTRRPTAGDAFAMTVDDATYRSRDTAASALGARMAAIAKDQSIRPGQHVPLGTLGGQDFHAEIVYGASGGRQLRLRFPWGNVVPIGHRDDRAQWQASTVTPSNGRGAIQSLERFLNHLDEDLEKLAASAATQSGRREEIITNLRSKDDNPYRIQARSKEREERALSKLVVANEKEQGLAERAERAASNNPDGQAEEEDEELNALREQIAKLRKAVEDEHRIQEQAAASARGETGQEPVPHSEAAGSEPDPAETAGTGTGEATTTASSTGPDRTTAGPQDQPRPEQPPADPGTETASETSREQQFQEALDELLSGAEAEPEEFGARDQHPVAGDDDPLLAQMIAHDMGALAGEGWTEVVRPFTSQREAAFEREHVQVVYERWAATQTALPMLVDADEELADEDPGITNPAGFVASWAYRARLAAGSAGPTGGRTVVEQYEGLARAARRADAHLAEQDAYVSDDDRALLLQVANTAGQYAQRLSATLDVLAQQAQERQETESQAETRMRELQVLENAMEYLRHQGSDFRMDRQNATITDREAAGTQLRDDLLRVMRGFDELPAERQNLDPDFRVGYANIRGIRLYVGWSDPGTPQARAVLGFDQLPLLDRDSFTAAELEAMPPAQLIDRLDGRLDLDTLEAVRDREREAIQDLLAAGAQGQQAPATDDAPTAQSGEPTANTQQPEPEALGEDSGDVAVPEGYQPFTDDSVQLEPGDVVREGWRQYMEDRHLRYRTVTVIEGPDPRDGYYRCRHQLGGITRMHPREIVAVPDGSRLLTGNTPEQQEPTTPAPQGAPEEAPATEAAPLQGLIDALGDRVSLTHIGGPQSGDEPAPEEPAAPAPAEAEQHTEPAPEIARIAAVLRYYEPLLKRHKLSGKDVVAYIDRPGVGYSYDPDNPLLDLVYEIGKVAERLGGTFRRSYNEWVTYEVGAQRAAQSDQLTNLNLDLLTLYNRETEPLFEVDLETILAAPPGTVIDLPEAPEQAPSAIVIRHDAEGTTVKGTRKDDQPVRNALKDQGFRWSQRQSMWYLRRDTPLDARADAVRGLRDFLDRIGTAYTAYYDGAPAPAPQNTEETAESPQETAPTPETAAPSAETAVHPVGWTIAALLSQQQLKTVVSAYVVDSQPVLDGGQRTERVREWIAVQQQTPTTAWYASPSSDLPEALRGNGDVRLSSGRDGISLEQAGRTTVLPWEEIPAWIEAAAAHDEAAREAKRSAKRRYGRLDREIHFRSDEQNTAARQAMEDLDVALWETAPPSEDQLAAARERFSPQPQEPSASPTAETPAADSTETTLDPSTTPEADPAQAEPDGNRQDSAPPLAQAPAETAEPEPEGDFADEQEEGDEPPADAAEGMVIVQTPQGPGRVLGTDGDLVLVSTQSGTRVYEGDEVQWPEGTTRPEDGDFAARRRRNEADLAQASTSEGIELNYGDGNRLVDLDAEAGHGTVVDADGAVVGWVRARLGDDGRRYWWGQDAEGGPPDSMPFHEALPVSAGVPAIRAAGHVRTGLTAVKEPAHRRPIPAEYASREVRLTTAQVRELRRLTLDSTYSDGTPVEPPEWVAGHRKYQLNVAQMQALGEAAEAAADAFPGVTAEERRAAKVLRNAAERFEFEVYDTARWRATIPPIGERDLYARPYQPRPRAAAAEEVPASALEQQKQEEPAATQPESGTSEPSNEPAPDATEAALAADSPPDPAPADAEQQTTESKPGPGPALDGSEEQLDPLSGGDSTPGPQKSPPAPAPAPNAAPDLPPPGPAPAANAPEAPAGPLAAPLADAEDALTTAEQVRSAIQRRSATDALDHARVAWDRARTSYEAGRLSEGDRHLTAARSYAIMARYTESRHADFQTLGDAVRRFHDAVDEILYPAGAGWRPAVGDYVRAQHRYVPESDGFWMKVTAIGADGIHVESGMTGEAKAVVPPDALGPHADLPWQDQPARAPGEPRASDQERRALLGIPPQTEPEPAADLPEPAQAQSAPADAEEQLDLFVGTALETPTEAAVLEAEATAPASGSPGVSPDTPTGAAPEPQGSPPADDLAQLARVELTGAADIRYWMHGSMQPGEPQSMRFHLNRQTRSYSFSDSIFTGTRDECVAYIDSVEAVRSAAEAADPGDENGEQRAAAQAWLREAAGETPAPDPAPADTPGAGEERAGAADKEEGQLNLFGQAAPAPAPESEPAPVQRPGRRRGRRQPEPAVSSGTEEAPHGRTGIYGHADHGECDRCGTPDTDRYTVVLHWWSEGQAEMAAECGPCVEQTLGLSEQQSRSLADLAEARRDGVQIWPEPYSQNAEIVLRRTAENEWTSVHRPTGQRYRTVKEAESGYRGFVMRDLSGVSVGTGISVGTIAELTERAALGRTAETHPTASDDWVFFSYREQLKEVALPKGESITARSSEARREQGPLEHGPMWGLSIGDTNFTVEMVYQQGLPGDDGHRLAVTDPGGTGTRHERWQGVLEWARARVRETEAEPADAATTTLAAAQTPASEPQEAPAVETTSSAPDENPATTEPAAAEKTVPQRTDDDPEQQDQEDAVADEPEPASIATDIPVGEELSADNLVQEDVEPAVDVEDPPEPRTFTETAPLANDDRYGLRLTTVEGEGLRDGELLYGEATVAVVRQSADGRWFARSAVDGLPADVTALNGSPQDAAHQAAILYAVRTGEPYGEPPAAAEARGTLSRVDVLRADLRTAADRHLRTITVAAARADQNYGQNPHLQDLTDALENLAAAVPDQHGSQQMTANLTAIQQAVNAWGANLPADPAHDERQFLAFPLLDLLYESTHLRGRLQATLDAVQAERAAAAAAPTEPVGREQAQQTPTPPQRVRGPVAVIGLREAADGQLMAMVNTVEASQALVLPGVTSGDLPGMQLPVRAEVPMLVRQAQQAEQLVSDEETHAWLAGHLADGPLAQAWSTDAVRQAIVVVVADVLRDSMAPSVDEVAAWLVATAPEQNGLLQAAHAAATAADFAPAFARAADDLVADGGSEHLIWRYLGDSEGNRRRDVLARATPDAYEQLRALPAPVSNPAPETAAVSETEPTAPTAAETLEEPEMATPARDDAPQAAQRPVGQAPQPGPALSIQMRQSAGGTLSARIATPQGVWSRAIRPSSFRRGPLPDLPLPMEAELPHPAQTYEEADRLVQGTETERWLARHLKDGPMDSAWKVREVRAGLGDLLRDTLSDTMAPTAQDIATWVATAAAQDEDLLHLARKEPLENFTRQGFARVADAAVRANDSALLRWAYFEQDGGQRSEVLTLAAPETYERLRAAQPPASAETVSPDVVQGTAPREELPTAAPSADNLPPHTPEVTEEALTPEGVSADTGTDTVTGERRPETGEVADSAAPEEPSSETTTPVDLPLAANFDWSDGFVWQEGPADLVSEFDGVKAAWDENVPAENGSSEDLFADVQEQLLGLQQLLAEAVAEKKPAPEALPVIPVQPAPAAEPKLAAAASASAEPETVPTDRDPQQAADAVNAALRQADDHAPALQDLPEWQRLQTVRGAFGHLVSVIKERAGEHFGRLMEDGRVADFLRRTSLRVCEKVAGWAQAGADRLRRDDERGQEQRSPLPSADALLRLGDAALAYRGPRGGGSTPPPASDVPDVNKVEALRRMGDALARPMPGTGKRVSAAAARGRSTTTGKRPVKGAKRSANGSGDQAGHLRRNADQPSVAKPNQQR